MFRTFIGKPVIARAVQYSDAIRDDLLGLFPGTIAAINNPAAVACFVDGIPVVVTKNDWIVYSNSAPGRLQVFTDAQFRNQFQEPEDLEILATANPELPAVVPEAVPEPPQPEAAPEPEWDAN